jgi:hypothetical protein
MALDWHLIAREAGFDVPESMFKSWYIENEWSIEDIANELGCATWTVRTALVKYGIKIRPHGGPRRKHT